MNWANLRPVLGHLQMSSMTLPWNDAPLLAVGDLKSSIGSGVKAWEDKLSACDSAEREAIASIFAATEDIEVLKLLVTHLETGLEDCVMRLSQMFVQVLRLPSW